MKTAVITGASQGIGKAIAEKLLQEGFSVAICARNETVLEEVVSKWKKDFPGASIYFLSCDAGDKAALAEFGNMVLERFESIDMLVNNAGTFQPGLLANEKEGQLEHMMEVNLYSAYNLTRQLLPRMKSQRQGHIFNMCSVASLKAYENGGSYSISKYALLGFSDNLREELRKDGIRVTSICPGATWTQSWQGSGLDESRFMRPEDIAESLWSAYRINTHSLSECIILRPPQGDI